MPPAARITDMHVCPKVEPGPVPHVGGPTTSGESTVIIGFMPAARVGDSLLCVGPGVSDSISQGESTVIIGNKPAARLGDPTSHGGVLVAGCPTVIIGSSAQGQTIVIAAQNGTPFCEECEKKKRAQAAQAQESLDSPAPAAGMTAATTAPGVTATSSATASKPKGGANPQVKKAASRGSTLHSDRRGHLPDQLRQKYPETQFAFTKPGVAGQDVKVTGGKHPSDYEGSTWKPGVNYGDFKPDSPSGHTTFKSDQKKKWSEETQILPYDPKTGKLK
ncbi:PAAR domain-containing protein [Hyalangium gracile]|uniref:PAAR domain-containing protein n=1 Tax=Hyalangium gracile TaxID=394092 RepID=UPI00295EBAFA|nr:PAAR domain-containing protein [Hyalangium gracile]